MSALGIKMAITHLPLKNTLPLKKKKSGMLCKMWIKAECKALQMFQVWSTVDQSKRIEWSSTTWTKLTSDPFLITTKRSEQSWSFMKETLPDLIFPGVYLFIFHDAPHVWMVRGLDCRQNLSTGPGADGTHPGLMVRRLSEVIQEHEIIKSAFSSEPSDLWAVYWSTCFRSVNVLDP